MRKKLEMLQFEPNKDDSIPAIYFIQNFYLNQISY